MVSAYTVSLDLVLLHMTHEWCFLWFVACKLDVDGNCFQVTLAANGKSADCSVEEEPWKREK